MNLKNLFIAAIAMAYLTGCMASKHPGVTTLPEPEKSHTDYQTWYLYYEDRLDAFKGDVMPPDATYPQEARNGYAQAKKEWDEKVRTARTSNIGMGAVAASVVVALIIYSSNSGY